MVILGNVVIVSAEDKVQDIQPGVFRLSGSLAISAEYGITTSVKGLSLGQQIGQGTELEGSKLSTPFGTDIVFPVVDVLKDENKGGVRPSFYILENLKDDFEYWEWDLGEYTELQLPEVPGYVLNVGGKTGQPEKVRWGIRRTGIASTGRFPIEHVLEYKMADEEWVRAISRGVNWQSSSGSEERLGIGESTDLGTVYWEGISGVENWSPLVNGEAPVPDMIIDENNTGRILGILITREVKVGEDCDFVSGIDVFGVVTKRTLTLSNDGIIPDGHFTIKHDLNGINEFVRDGKYAAVGSGTITSLVTDYEDDATRFTQEIIVSTSGKTEVNIYYPGGDIPYQEEWMSKDTSADTSRRGGLVVQSSSRVNGTYDLVTMLDGGEIERAQIIGNKGDNLVEGLRRGWEVSNTDETGIRVTSRAYVLEDYETTLTDESDAKYMRFDSTLPTINEVVAADDEWRHMPYTDADDGLSGLETKSGGVYYKFIESGATEGITTPNDDTDWLSLKDYELPEEPNEYDLYVYAKDNATNRSGAIKANEEPIVVPSSFPAKIILAKTIADNKGNNKDIFLIHLKEDGKNLGSVTLKKNEESEWLTLDMAERETRTIEIQEVVPMDYQKGYRIAITATGEDEVWLDEDVTEITVKQGDEMKITIENTFDHAGYFRDKKAVKNLFEKMITKPVS